jgi:cell wall-associated NlpC family hydrolase
VTSAINGMSALGGAGFVPGRVLELQSRFGGGAGAGTAAPMSTVDFQALLAKAEAQVLQQQAQAQQTRSSQPAARPVDATYSVSATAMPAPAGQTQAQFGRAIVDNAKQYLGVPYVWGGESLEEGGFDCSGLVQQVFKNLGVDVPRTADLQAEIGTPVASLDQAMPGDLVCFNDPVDHIGIYAGNGQMVVAPHTGDVVKVQSVYKTPSYIRRISPPGGAATTPKAPILYTAEAYTAGAPGSAGASVAGSGVPAGTPYADLFNAAGARYGIDPSLVAAVAKVESGFNPSAVSPAGAQGLMQFMPATAAGIGINPLDPAQAIDGGARYLATQLQQFGSTDLALAADNAGPGAVQQWGGIPPYAQTQAYVRRVQSVLNGGA